MDDSGQGLVEYSLVISLVSMAALASMKMLGQRASNTFSNAAAQLR
jgi:Flp pilus assembly pilin Flp